MIPLVIQNRDITTEHILVFSQIQRIVHWIDEPKIDCHKVCELIMSHAEAKKLLEHVKGKFMGHDHSWLRFKDNSEVIIDPYPIAVGSGPILLFMSMTWRLIYKEENY